MRDHDSEFDKKAFLKKVMKNVTRLRKMKGYSQDRLTLEAGLSRGSISKIERSLVDPQISTLARIADTLGVPLRDFFDFKNLD